MRSGFGRMAVELRLARGMSQKKFCEEAGMSLSRVSNIEYQRTAISDDVVGVYIRVLNCNGEEAYELRKRAQISNEIRSVDSAVPDLPPLQAMLSVFGEKLSDKAKEQIRQIIERETGEKIDALAFSSNQSASKAKKKAIKKQPRSELTAERFVEIALLAETVRARQCLSNEKLDIGLILDRLVLTEKNLDYLIVDEISGSFQGAFAYISGHREGHTIVLEESRMKSALNGVYFARHVIAHEIGHHFLHGNLLQSDKISYLEPQQLSRNQGQGIGKPTQIRQVVDTFEEVEAEIFATLLLVPWTAFYKGTLPRHLAEDFGEQPDNVADLARYFRVPTVKDAFKMHFWRAGKLQHMIFNVA